MAQYPGMTSSPITSRVCWLPSLLSWLCACVRARIYWEICCRCHSLRHATAHDVLVDYMCVPLALATALEVLAFLNDVQQKAELNGALS